MNFLLQMKLLEKRNKLTRYTTGSEDFDNLLNGGFETQAITELAGEFGSGKSQICHTLCARHSIDGRYRYTDMAQDMSTGNIIFIDSENTFQSKQSTSDC